MSDSPNWITARDAALAEKHEDELAGVHSCVGVGIGDDGRDEGHTDNLSDGVLAQFAVLAEFAPVNVRLDEKCANAAAHDAETDERDQLDEDPRFVVLDEEEHRVLVAEGVDGAENESGDEGAEERPPERLQREVVRDFLQAEQNSTNRRTEGDGHAGRGCC